MIQLFVNNSECELPYDFSYTMFDENPEITNNGEFSLDMTLSLLEPRNAIAFNFINRLNVVTINKNADAYIIENGKVKHGIVIISDNTDISVTFQFAAGNSQLNYNLKNDTRKIWELDWGEETPIDYARALNSIRFLTDGKNDNFICTPIYIGTKVYNDYIIDINLHAHPSKIVGVNNILMQPYMLYYIKKLPSLLGFSLKFNELENDERALKMFIINSIDSLFYADALPDMTISEFVNAIESFFNVLFFVDKTDKSISIETQRLRLSQIETIQVENVLDSYERDLSETEKNAKLGFTSIKYNFPDNEYFKYQQISDDNLKKITVQNFANISAIKTAANNATLTDKNIIYRDKETGNDYALVTPTKKNYYTVDGGSGGQLTLINKFRSFIEDSTNETNELILKIQPAQIQAYNFTVPWFWDNSGFPAYPQVMTQVPISSNVYGVREVDFGLKHNIETGIKNVTRNTFIEVSLYKGMQEMYITKQEVLSLEAWKDRPISIYYPMSATDNCPDLGKLGVTGNDYTKFEAWKFWDFDLSKTKTMKILGPYGIMADYQNSRILDSSKVVIFTLVDSPDMTANKIFMIKNKRYMPISLERQISINSRKTVTGRFYAMQLAP